MAESVRGTLNSLQGFPRTEESSPTTDDAHIQWLIKDLLPSPQMGRPRSSHGAGWGLCCDPLGRPASFSPSLMLVGVCSPVSVLPCKSPSQNLFPENHPTTATTPGGKRQWAGVWNDYPFTYLLNCAKNNSRRTYKNLKYWSTGEENLGWRSRTIRRLFFF